MHLERPASDRHPIHAMLVQFPIVCFVGAFITDIVYWRSMSFIWETFSVWLLTAGLVGAGLAAIAGWLTSLQAAVFDSGDRPGPAPWEMGLLLHCRSSTFSSLTSHVAPLGMAFYTGTALPSSYKGGAFVGEHGSWDRSPFNGYRVVFVPFKDGKSDGPAQDVVTGFLNSNDEAARPACRTRG
jgi:hypothetical protein